MNLRKNTHLAWVVENGIVLAEMAGLALAGAYLALKNVPPHVIVRVLGAHKGNCSPCRRRYLQSQLALR